MDWHQYVVSTRRIPNIEIDSHCCSGQSQLCQPCLNLKIARVSFCGTIDCLRGRGLCNTMGSDTMHTGHASHSASVTFSMRAFVNNENLGYQNILWNLLMDRWVFYNRTVAWGINAVRMTCVQWEYVSQQMIKSRITLIVIIIGKHVPQLTRERKLELYINFTSELQLRSEKNTSQKKMFFTKMSTCLKTKKSFHGTRMEPTFLSIRYWVHYF